jgi:hypothetical protein
MLRLSFAESKRPQGDARRVEATATLGGSELAARAVLDVFDVIRALRSDEDLAPFLYNAEVASLDNFLTTAHSPIELAERGLSDTAPQLASLLLAELVRRLTSTEWLSPPPLQQDSVLLIVAQGRGDSDGDRRGAALLRHYQRALGALPVWPTVVHSQTLDASADGPVPLYTTPRRLLEAAAPLLASRRSSGVLAAATGMVAPAAVPPGSI